MPEYVNKFRKPETVSTTKSKTPVSPLRQAYPYISTGCISVRVAWNEIVKINSGSEHLATTIPDGATHVQGDVLFAIQIGGKLG